MCIMLETKHSPNNDQFSLDAFYSRWTILLEILFIFQQTVPCYQTKFTPLKKQSKQSKTLSDNIKKFLARKEEEEKQKAFEEKRKKEVS